MCRRETPDRRLPPQSSIQPPRPAFHALLAMRSLKHVILSNAGEERFVELGRHPRPGRSLVLRAYRKGGEWL